MHAGHDPSPCRMRCSVRPANPSVQRRRGSYNAVSLEILINDTVVSSLERGGERPQNREVDDGVLSTAGTPTGRPPPPPRARFVKRFEGLQRMNNAGRKDLDHRLRQSLDRVVAPQIASTGPPHVLDIVRWLLWFVYGTEPRETGLRRKQLHVSRGFPGLKGSVVDVTASLEGAIARPLGRE